MSLTQFLKGIVIILVGAILLLNNLNILGWSVWLNILRLWPLLLVSLGISLIFRKKLSWLGPLIILLGIIFGISTNYMGLDLQLEGKITTEVETIQREMEMVPAVTHDLEQEIATEGIPAEETLETTIETEGGEVLELEIPETTEEVSEDIVLVPLFQKVNLHLNYDIGTFTLKSSTPLVYQCLVSYRNPEFKPIEDFSILDHVATALITHQPISDKMTRNPKNNIDLKLNTNVVYDILLETGATSIDYDLSKFKIENLSIESGASKINIIAPQYNGKINIDSGVSAIDIAIPKNVGTMIYLDTGLSIKDFDEYFQKQEDNVYISKNYNTSEYHVDIEIDSGISQINIHYL